MSEKEIPVRGGRPKFRPFSSDSTVTDPSSNPVKSNPNGARRTQSIPVDRYRYEPLQDSEQDIRVLTLLPGNFEEEVRIRIHHVPLVAREPGKNRRRMTRHALQGTLPDGWEVFETREGRYVFRDANGLTYWNHPRADFDKELYRSSDERATSFVDYSALSYAWGEPTELIDILVECTHTTGRDVVRSTHLATFQRYCEPSNGDSEGLSRRRLPVGENLASALRFLRHKTKDYRLWIDAICINQGDTSERSKQVGRMRDIYALAPRVVVWLGESSPKSGVALHALKYLSNQLIITQENDSYPHPDAADRSLWAPNTPLPYTPDVWSAIEDIYERSYFQRLWIWQEVILADDRAIVHCGGEQLDWAMLRCAIRRTFQPRSYMPPQMRRRFVHVGKLAFMIKGYPILSYMDAATDQVCADPRDRVYAMLGLVCGDFARAIAPNYQLSAAQVYRDAVLAYIEYDRNLDLFLQCDLGNRAMNMASWIPDWSVPKTRRLLGPSSYFPSLRMPPNWTYISPEKLEVLGIRCATLKSVSTETIDREPSLESVLRLRTSIPEDVLTAGYKTGESKLDAYVATLCANQLEDAFAFDSGYQSLAEARENFQTHFTGLDHTLPNMHQGNHTDQYIRKISFESWGNALLETEEGYIGTGSPTARAGDIACVIQGCGVPVLLRKKPFDQYEVVSAIYLHGFMYGEALLGPFPTSWRPRIFDIDETHWCAQFYNPSTKESTFEDPRLPTLPSEWRLIQEIDERNHERRFENTKSGYTTAQDPRTTKDALMESGVKFEAFSLV